MSDPILFQLAALLGASVKMATDPIMLIAVVIAAYLTKQKKWVPVLVGCTLGLLNAFLSQWAGKSHIDLPLQLVSGVIGAYIAFAIFLAVNALRLRLMRKS